MYAIMPRGAGAAPSVLVCLLVSGLLVGSADGAPVIGFRDTSVSTSPLFTFESQGTNTIGDDILTTNDPVTVDLQLDLSGVGQGDALFMDALFEFDAALTDQRSRSLAGWTVHELRFDGSFLFKEDGSGDPILTATFSDARMWILSDRGVVKANTGLRARGPVGYTAGPALPGVVFAENEGFRFRTDDVQDLFGGPVDVNHVRPPDKYQFEDFTFNSSFLGFSGVVPEPTTLSLLALGAAVAMRRRR